MPRTRLYRSVRNGLVVGFQSAVVPAPHCMPEACPAPSDTDDLLLAIGTLPPLVEDVAFSYTPTLTGGLEPFTFALAEDSDPLPTGLTLDPETGEISGTPTVLGPTTVTIVVTDGLGQTSELELDLDVYTLLEAGLDLTPPSPQQGVVMTAYTPTVTGGLAPYTWALAAGSDPLPAGLTLAPATGIITGTPTLAGAYDFELEVTDDAGQTDLLAISLTVAPP